jgi:phosphoribosyl-ATP pyrophosphohydrolase/phosphoribosyl-AMP cyclohydrolase
MLDLTTVNFEKGGGTVTVVTRDNASGVVLMVASANREALEKTLATGEMHYTSRSRGLWHKGETSGNTQKVVTLAPDCDGDAILATVEPRGPACHTGEYSCFGIAPTAGDQLRELDAVIEQRAREMREGSGNNSQGTRTSYTQRLLSDRNLRLKKVGEECAEFITACADNDSARSAEEAADIIYHVAVALHASGATLGDAMNVLAARAAGARQ